MATLFAEKKPLNLISMCFLMAPIKQKSSLQLVFPDDKGDCAFATVLKFFLLFCCFIITLKVE